jgi:hypothetical protein
MCSHEEPLSSAGGGAITSPRTLHRAKEQGSIPQEAQLTPRDPRMTAWDDIPWEFGGLDVLGSPKVDNQYHAA